MIKFCLDDLEWIFQGTTNPEERLGVIKICLDDLELIFKEQTILKRDSA